MSEEEGSSSSESELGETLVQGRTKRATAGNRLEYLLQHLDDEDIQADLVDEDEGDQQDYSASEDDGDVALDSSSDEEDEGPAREGQDPELEGEKEIQKQERAEAKRKRKARDVVKIPPMRKRVKIADGLSGEESSRSVRPRKKSERTSWLPSTDDAPTRQSLRAQTVASKIYTEIKLKETLRRAEKTQIMMKIAAEKKAAQAGPVLTQADRMARALKIEKENSRSLNRWEQAEQERLQLQKEKLEAMRNRTLEGPYIRHWSGPVIWQWREGADGQVTYAKMKYRARPKPVVEVIDQPIAVQRPTTEEPSTTGPAAFASSGDTTQIAQAQDEGESRIRQPEIEQTEIVPTMDQVQPMPKVHDTGQDNTPISKSTTATAEQSESIADVLSKEATADPSKAPTPTPDPITESPARNTQLSEASSQHEPVPSMPPYTHIPDHLRPPTPPPPAPLAPLHREPAARNLITLESFPTLSNLPPQSSRRASTLPSALTTAISAILLPESATTTFSAQEQKYLAAKHRRETQTNKTDLLPPPPAKVQCVISNKAARFRDPGTGLGYRDLTAYKSLHRVVGAETAWSVLTGAWMGCVGDGAGRVAKGVPEGFWTGAVRDAEDKGVKVEDGVKATGKAGSDVGLE